MGVLYLGTGKEEGWGGMRCCQRLDFKCQVGEENTCGTEVGGRLHFMGQQGPWNRYKEALDADGEVPEDDGKRWYSVSRFYMR